MPKVRRLSEEEIRQLEDRVRAARSATTPEAPPRLHVTEQAIRAWAGDTSISRGRGYVGDAILNPRVSGQTLKASVQGSQPRPYRVTVTLGSDGHVVDADCSCPVGGGGRCKHVAALLMTYLEAPDDFTEIEDLDRALEARTKAELIALIRQMVAREPDLELLIELPVPGGKHEHKLLKPETIRRQARAAIGGGGYEWGDIDAIATNLEGLVRVGDGYARAGDWRNAAIVYTAVAGEVLEHYDELHSEEGDLSTVVDECVGGLGKCLEAASDPSEREVLLRALFDVYQWDVEYGGIGMGDQASELLLGVEAPDERQRIAAWIREAIPEGNDWSSTYHREVYGGMLLELEQDTLDDEAFLRICRETGRTHDLITRLLELGRVDEALAETRQVGDNQILSYADIFHNAGHPELAERIVRERTASAQYNEQMLDWLQARAEERGDLNEALDLGLALFYRRPTRVRYEQIEELASRHGRWKKLRPEMLKRLAQEQHYDLLTEIHLRADEVGQALQTLRQAKGWTTYGDEPLSIRVARAAEQNFPRESIRIYTAAAEQLIKAQGRANYTTAAGYLARTCELYRRLGEESTWTELIARIRDEYRRLRALREELDLAGV